MLRLSGAAPWRAARTARVLAVALAIGGCAPHARGPARVTCTWVAACAAPAFDPAGPPHPVRWALERLLSHGLFLMDSTGRVAAAPGITARSSADGLTWTFHIAPDLRFTDGSRCGSAEFRAALERGLARGDHGSFLWLLSALEGADRVRAGRPLPRLGIEAADPATLILHLRHPDARLAEKLALPGVGVPWAGKPGAAGRWEGAAGLGPYRMVRQDSTRRLVLSRAQQDPACPDTVVVRFVVGPGRVLAFLRAGTADLVWPVPAGVGRSSLPAAYRAVARDAEPARSLDLVMRADLPPTSQLPARHALAQSLNSDEVLRAVGERARPPGPWIVGGPAFEPPSLDQDAVRRWMDLARLGRSFHVRMAYDADGAGAEAARVMQGNWARLGIYVELDPLRGPALAQQLLSGNAHLLLVEEQPLTRGVEGMLADLVLPLRGPAVGSFRTGWRTREFDAWLDPRRPAAPADPAALSHRLDDEALVVPIARLPWFWIERAEGPGVAFHPRFGPECTVRRTEPQASP